MITGSSEAAGVDVPLKSLAPPRPVFLHGRGAQVSDAGVGKIRALAGGKFRAMKLKRNTGTFDVAARVTAAGVLLILANHGHAAAGWAGAVLLACAVTRFCPLWWLLGVDTGRREKIYRQSPWPPDEGPI
jgi:hypothetical protein